MTDKNEIIMFTRGNPAVEALPIDVLTDCATEIFKKEGKVIFQYGHYSGYKPLREWIAGKYTVDVDQVLLGNSSMEFLTFLSFAMLEKGDTVFLEYPSYDRAVTAMKRSKANVVGIPMDNDGVDIDKFREQIDLNPPKFFYTVPDFQNPTGITTSLERRRVIAELAVKHNFYIIEDAPYKPLRYYGEDISEYRKLAPGNVLFISSFSKVLSPGIRVGFLIGPKQLMPKIHKWSEDTYIHPALVSEGIVYEFCRRGLLEPNIERLKNLYRPRLDGILKALDNHMKGKADWAKPEGGFFISVFLPESVDGDALQKNSKEHGFLVSSGNGYFTDGKGERLLRLPFCQMDPAETEEGVKRLAAAVDHFQR